MPTPLVIVEESAADPLARGCQDLAELLARTLGPTQGFVLNQREHMGPEVIEDSASAARRITETPDRASNVGTMLLRNTARQVHLRAGDGVATSAVLSQAILRQATRYVRAGGNPMAVKRGEERAIGVAVASLVRQWRPVKGEEELTRLAQTITGNPALSLVLGEMLDVLGPEYGRLLSKVREADLGDVDRADATAEELLIRGGAGGPVARRAGVDGLRLKLAKQAGTEQERDALRLRLSRVATGAGVLKIGAYTVAERESRHQRAEKAIRALGTALEEDVVPDGGAAFIWAIREVRSFAASLTGDEGQGAKVLAEATEEPCRRIVRYRREVEPEIALAELYPLGQGHAYEVLAGRVVSAEESGLEDPLGVSRAALEIAVSGALSALTVAVMVLRRVPSKNVGA